ncbi:hypothetical protein BJ875DRAFT_450085 [Amylocarpus encephaloides]|uniref:NAD(P)-binding protein n=1 Tax=Amylocarpus encephaloides TaxID=45428 RepID=A0A9P8C9U4_9HELO|nr:hypothetical protein BJ875DRAFT_450085 [Amylocarpus encephaloides]
MSFSNLRDQWFPPTPAFLEGNVPSQAGKVLMVTGGNSGVGFELCKMLYGKGAVIYMACRSKERAERAIRTIKDTFPDEKTPSQLKFLEIDLNDLKSVKTAAATFARQEAKLDILWNNAGTGANNITPGTRTKQDFEAMIGMHCIATLLFTQLLVPQLRAAATSSSSPGSTRVIWTASFMIEIGTPENGIDFSLLSKGTLDGNRNYSVSKLGSWLLSREFARLHGAEGIVSVAQNPGNLKTDVYDGTPWYMMFFVNWVLHDAKYGAYTELFAGLSPDLGLGEGNGKYVIPWGRIRGDEECPRKDIIKAITSVEDGGLGYDKKFWRWCEGQYKPFV